MDNRLSLMLLADVYLESTKAHNKHVDNGGSLFGDLSIERRLAALGEEYGEVCRSLTYDGIVDKEHLIKELIQVATVAFCWAQWLDSQDNENETSPDN